MARMHSPLPFHLKIPSLLLLRACGLMPAPACSNARRMLAVHASGSAPSGHQPDLCADRAWELIRIDDNDNCFVISTFKTREEAEAAMRAFEVHKHKQTYIVQPSIEKLNTPPNPTQP